MTVKSDDAMDEEPRSQALIGTIAYDNWRAWEAGAPALETLEHLLYADAHLTGEVNDGLGPYAFLNLVPDPLESQRCRASFVLRWSFHLRIDLQSFEKTEHSRYHGGDLTDEIAALASLKCGVRIHAGSLSRRFEGLDPRGRPVAWFSKPEPFLDLSNRRLVLPTVRGTHSIMAVQQMASFPVLKPNQGIALVRAARLYQQALWLAESDPNSGWLLLVAAIETAANLWRSKGGSAIEQMRESNPEFTKYLDDTGVDQLAIRVANKFRSTFGVTKKFVDFLSEFCPEPPELRPPEVGQIDWSEEGLKATFKKIYAHRSNVLHGGIPFPAPMCAAPIKFEKSWNAPMERPVPQASHGATWLAEDLPMHLHIFEYITRRALDAWWFSMVAPESQAD